MTDLCLDPDDGRRDGAPMPKPVFPSPFKPEPILHLIQDPDRTRQRAMAAALDDAISRVYADYCRKVVARAEELAGYGLGLGEVDYEVVTDPDDPAKVTVRGMWKIVRLNDNEETR